MKYSEKLLQEFPYADQEKLNRKMITHFIIAMCFPISAGFYYFGLAMIRTAVACVVFSVLTEWVLNKLMKKESTLGDLTAVATGLVISLNMRPGVGLYPLLLACIVAIAIGKIIFGGVGFNPVNPAVVGRLLPVAGFPSLWANSIRPTIPTLMEYAGLTYWEALQYTFVQDVTTLPFYNKVSSAHPAYAPYSFSSEINQYYDVLSGGTYLSTVKTWYKSGVMPSGMNSLTEFFDYWTLFIGNMPGTLGETSKLAILLGFAYLVITKVISPLIPMLILGFMGIFGWVFSGTRLGLGLFAGDPLIWILSGGIMLGSVYMATEPVTAPRGTKATVLYALIFASIVTSIRMVFSFAEGVAFTLLSTSLIMPFINGFCSPEHKNAKLITKSFVGVGAVSAVFLLGMLIYTIFFSTPKAPLHETHIKSVIPNATIITPNSHPNGVEYYTVDEIGNAYILTEKAFDNGEITMLVVISDNKIVKIGAIDLSSQTEGFGQNAYESSFLGQFDNKKLSDVPVSSLEWVEIDMLSGVTVTSDAIAKTIHRAFELESSL